MFPSLQDSAKFLLLSSRMYFSSLLRKFWFLLNCLHNDKTHHLDPATPQNNFLHLVIPTYFPFSWNSAEEMQKHLSTVTFSKQIGAQTWPTDDAHPGPVTRPLLTVWGNLATPDFSVTFNPITALEHKKWRTDLFLRPWLKPWSLCLSYLHVHASWRWKPFSSFSIY